MATIITQKSLIPIIEVHEAEHRVTFEFGGELIEYNFYIDVTQKSVAMVLGELQQAAAESRLGTYLTGALASNLLQVDPDNPSVLTDPILMTIDI